MKRHVILVGLSGSGKTSVAEALAKRWSTDYADYTDLDRQVEQEEGCSIEEIFARWGEAEFRRREREAMERALARPPHLVAAGAGWIAQPGNLERAQVSNALLVYLRVTPEVAAARLAGEEARPLLAGAAKLGRLRELLAEREAWYARAEAAVEAEGPVELVAAEVAAVVRARAG